MSNVFRLDPNAPIPTAEDDADAKRTAYLARIRDEVRRDAQLARNYAQAKAEASSKPARTRR